MKDQVSAKLANEIYEIRLKSMINAIEQLGEERVKEVLRKLYVDYAMSTPLMSETLKKGTETIRRWLIRFRIPIRERCAFKYLKLVPTPKLECVRREIVNGKLVKAYRLYSDTDLSYLCGFTIGDGTCAKRRIEMRNTEFGLLQPIKSMANRIAERLDVTCRVYLYDKDLKLVENATKAYLWGIPIYSTPLSRLMNNGKGQLVIENIKSFLKSPNQGYFLAGLWDADGGCLWNEKERKADVELYQYALNILLLKEIERHFIKGGIPCRVYVSKETQSHFSHIKGKIVRREDVYALRILRRGLEKWIGLVGDKMLHPKKRKNIEKIKRGLGLISLGA